MFTTGKIARAAAVIAAVMFCATSVSPAMASDDVIQMIISDALASPDAQAKLDGTVKFYFGQTPHPAVQHNYGEGVSNKKANSFGKSDMKACNRAFLSALLQFQARAHDLGANAVINIHSFFKKEEASSETQLPCHSGFLMAGVTLKGEFVRLSGR